MIHNLPYEQHSAPHYFSSTDHSKVIVHLPDPHPLAGPYNVQAHIVDGPNAHENAHAVRKFKAIRMVLSMGYSVLYTDVDVVLTGNPFDHLMRDVDVEVMSDSWDDSLAYGVWHSAGSKVCP